MPKPLTNRADLPLAALAVPMLLESLLRTTLTSADVFMLAFYSQSAVAASGLVNQFTFFLFIMYMMISSGTSVLIAQYLGANRDAEAGEAALGAFVLTSLFAIILSIGMALGARSILGLYRLDSEVERFGVQYLVITGGGSIFVAFNIVQATVLRSYGHAKDAMWSNMTANVLNVIGNAIAIFGPFGLPITGVVGVAFSTVFSQAVACLILSLRIRSLRSIAIPWRRAAALPAVLYKRLLRFGVPIASENLSYNLAQIVNSWIIAGFGTAALSANVYGITLMRFAFMPAMCIGNAGQIKVGYFVGAGRFAEAKRSVWRYYGIGFGITLAVMSGLYIARFPLLRIFTQDSDTIALVSMLFLISFFRETGRAGNIIIIPALKGSGDVLFPAIIGIIFMWSFGVGGAWLMGKTLGWGLAGVWLALGADEWARSLLAAWRWHSDAWRTKAVVKGEPR